MLDVSIIQNMVRRAFKGRSVSGFEILAGGLINTNLRVQLDNGESVVLRVHRDGAAACRKELALHSLVRESTPVASIIHAEPDGVDGSSAFTILEYVEGITFQELKRTGQHEAFAEAAYSVGKVLASIGRHEFPRPGRVLVDDISNELKIGESFVNSNHQIAELVDSFLESPTLQRRASPRLTSALRTFFSEWSQQLTTFLDDRRLVHCDFGNRNVLASNRSGNWEVAAVLDWELAISGSPLLDVGNVLRYDYVNPLLEPHFSQAFVEHGGYLPEDWRRIVRVLDLAGLVECLTHERLPVEVESEITQLIHATIDEVSTNSR